MINAPESESINSTSQPSRHHAFCSSSSSALHLQLPSSRLLLRLPSVLTAYCHRQSFSSSLELAYLRSCRCAMAGGTPKPPPRLGSSLFPTPIPPLNKPSLIGFDLTRIGLSSNSIEIVWIGIASMSGQEDWNQLEHSSNPIITSRVKVEAAVGAVLRAEFRVVDPTDRSSKAMMWYKIKLNEAKPSCMLKSSQTSSLCLTIWTIRLWDPGSCSCFKNSIKVPSFGFRMRRRKICSPMLSVQASRRDDTPARLGE